MIWVILLFALVLIYLAATRRLEALEARFILYAEKARAAFDYFKEDVRDVEEELEERLAAKVEEDVVQEAEHQRYKQTLQAEASREAGVEGERGAAPPGA